MWNEVRSALETRTSAISPIWGESLLLGVMCMIIVVNLHRAVDMVIYILMLAINIVSCLINYHYRPESHISTLFISISINQKMNAKIIVTLSAVKLLLLKAFQK